MRGFFPPLNKVVMRNLEVDFSLEDTKKALMGMGSLKAPGPNGYQPIFFKSTWVVTGEALHNFSQKTFREKGSQPKLLIPKDESPASIGDFRPLSLCNVCVKVVSWMKVK